MSRKRKNVYSKCIVALVILLNTVFAAIALHINYSGYDVSPTLITCWYAFTGGELLACAGIQIAKVRNEPTYEDSDTDNRTLQAEYDSEVDDDADFDS